MCTMRKRGLSSAVICTESFLKLANNQSKVFGVPDLHKIVIPHPLGGLTRDRVMERAEIVVPKLADFIDELSAMAGAKNKGGA